MHFAFPDAEAGYDISIEEIKFYNCYPATNEFTVEIIDNPCTGELVVPADTNNGGSFVSEKTIIMGEFGIVSFTDFSNGECTWELEIVSINSETDSTLWPALYELTQPTFQPQTNPSIDDDRIVDLD